MDLAARLLDIELAVCRLAGDAAVPDWIDIDAALISMTRTEAELSIVCSASRVPAEVECERGWAVIEVEGPLPFSATGVLATLATPLAQAAIPIFAISTYLTDYLLVPGQSAGAALEAIRRAGVRVLN